MNKTKNLLSILILLGAFIANAYAQEKSDTLEYKYPFEVLITAPRLNMLLKESPFATSVVTQDFLKVMPRSIAVDEALKLIPGLKVDNQADGERVHLSIRGQGILSEHGIRGIKVLLDGIPLNDPTGFTPDFYDVDWAGVQRVEVLRGPAASLYGGSSSSGIINITTKDITQKPIGGQVFLSSGTFNAWKYFGQVGTGWKNGDANISLSREMGDGYRVHTHFWGNKVWSKADFELSKKIHITPVFGYVNFYNENAEGLNQLQVQQDPRQPNGDAVPKNEYIQTERYTGGLSGVFEINKHHSVLLTGFVRGTKYNESVPSSEITKKMMAPGGSLQYNINFGNKKLQNTISIGADLQYQKIDETINPNLGGGVAGPDVLADYSIKQTGIGAFFADRLQIGPLWSALANVRYDQIKNELTDNLKNPVDLSGNKNFSKATGRVGLTFTPNKTVNIYANWGMGFLPPATEELDANPDAFGGFNNNLTFATSQGFELGVRGSAGKKLYADLAGFYLTTDNDFDRFRVSTRPSETFYKNSGKSKRFGFELYTKVDPVKLVTLQFAYTYSNFKYDMADSIKIVMDDTSVIKYAKKDNFLPNSPEHQLYVDLQLNLLKNLSVGISSETYSRSFIDGANLISESVGGYTLWGGRITYRTLLLGANAEITVNVRNIFSKQYIAFTEPDPGGNSYQPGQPLEAYLNVRVGF
jgi:iron complex outermembrane receptor protein